ncbi:minor capsid protein [Stutzerimonas nitrititolerans]|uniref:minor capsid protein n=1 Tax=Stutzerimonas nitrititolerans TaxID=2482751 RepID=UPI00289E215B|nr:minor capsid protein [Stutzerimonas nitrititolerans]
MATAERLIEAATRNSVLLERLKAGEVQKIDPFLRRIDKDIRERLSRDALTAYSRQRLETMLATIDAMIAKVQGEFSEQLLLDLFDIGSYEAEFEARSLDQVLVNISVATPTVQAIQAAVKAQPLSVTGPDGGKLLEPFIADWLQAERNRVTGAIRMGYVQGETNQQIINRIRGTKALQYSDGLLSISRRNAEAVVRTGIQHVASVARMETWKANSDVVTGWRFLATMDGRTSTQCRSLDQRVFKMGQGPLPPLHIRCRSSMTAELDARYKFLDEDATRASKDGYVSADLTYYEWLKGQSSEFQEIALGKARAKLFRDGGLSAKRFAELQLDRRFMPLTLDQMKALEPAAFRRAGID